MCVGLFPHITHLYVTVHTYTCLFCRFVYVCIWVSFDLFFGCVVGICCQHLEIVYGGVMCRSLYICTYVSFVGLYAYIYASCVTHFLRVGVRSRDLQPTHCFWVCGAGLFTYVFGSLLTYLLGCAVALCVGVMCRSQYIHIYVSFAGLFMFVFGSLLTYFLGVHSWGLLPTRWHCVRASRVCHSTYIYMSLSQVSLCLCLGLFWRITLALCAGVMCLSQYIHIYVSFAGLFVFVFGPLLTYHIGTVCRCHVFVTVHTYICLFRRSFYVCVWASFDVFLAVCSRDLRSTRWRCVRVSCVCRGSCSWRTCACLSFLRCVAACCSVLYCIVVCCSVLQCDAACCSLLQCAVLSCNVLHCVAMCCSV